MRPLIGFLFLLDAALAAGPPPVLGFEVKLDTVLKHDDGKFLWFHPRPTAIPGLGRGGAPLVVLTLQKHLTVSDYYSGLFTIETSDLGAAWSGPSEIPELGWVPESPSVDIAVADVTPGWHARTRRLIAIGAQIRYSKRGEQLEDRPRSNQTAYAVFDPQTHKWTRWKQFEMPPGDKFNYARNGCAQWIVEQDGTLLIPFYYGRNAKAPSSVTVVRARFDGAELKYLSHGTEMELNVVRGLAEPSIVRYGGKYYLTIRNDLKGYIAVSDDGLHYRPMKEWKFDDGSELGSYNTQQHWLAHSGGLFLSYTRRGAGNDHIFRHRAPLFIAQVDPDALVVMRRTEKILIPERGASLGNFGAAAITEKESWVTEAEYVGGAEARRRGAEGATFVARVIWSKPNRLVKPLQ